MVLWRISRHRDLKGIGGLRASGRWHFPGQPVVYLSESAASALLEVCVHTAANDVPPSFTLLRVEGPDAAVPAIRVAELPPDWREAQDVTRELGSAWLARGEAAVLEIPSAIVPQTRNYLFNPLHPEARAWRIVEALEYPFDGRIKR